MSRVICYCVFYIYNLRVNIKDIKSEEAYIKTQMKMAALMSGIIFLSSTTNSFADDTPDSEKQRRKTQRREE